MKSESSLQGRRPQMKGENMKKEFNFKGAKRGARITADTAKISVTARLDSDVVSWLRQEATRLGLPYQTLMNSLLKQSMNGSALTEQKVREIVREELTKKA